MYEDLIQTKSHLKGWVSVSLNSVAGGDTDSGWSLDSEDYEVFIYEGISE